MIKKPITIQIPSGLEARPVALLVQVASQFESDIYVESEQRRVNAKSIMGMMTLGLTSGEDIMVSASGEDEPGSNCKHREILKRQGKLNTNCKRKCAAPIFSGLFLYREVAVL